MSNERQLDPHQATKMSNERKLPESWEDWNYSQLRAECELRGITSIGLKHELIRNIVDHDIAQRALLPRSFYDSENDPDGSLRFKQIGKDYEDSTRDNLAYKVEARYCYEKALEILATRDCPLALLPQFGIHLLPRDLNLTQRAQSNASSMRQAADATKATESMSKPDATGTEVDKGTGTEEI